MHMPVTYRYVIENNSVWDTIPNAPLSSQWTEVTGARVVLFDHTKPGNILVLVSNVDGHVELPGGKVEGGSTFEETAQREAHEETGHTISITIRDLGEIIEYRSGKLLKKVSRCFVGVTQGNAQEVRTLTQKEVLQNMRVESIPIITAAMKIRDVPARDERSSFKREREALFVEWVVKELALAEAA
jgi:8-oxo-dGTP pyrophosphatase MutT (NUDIX family)